MESEEKDKLELEKLRLETRKIKNPWYNLEFYKTIITLIAVIGTIIFSWKSGFFDFKEKQLKLEATILELKKTQLTISVDSLESQKSKISDTLNKMNQKLLSAEFEMSNLENNLVRIKRSLSNTEYLLLVKKVDVALDNIKNELLNETPNSIYNLEQDFRYISLYPKFNTIIQNRIKDRIQNEFNNNSNILIRIYGFRIMSLFVKNEYRTEWSKLAIQYIDSSFTSRSIWVDDNIKNEYLFGPRLITDSIYIEPIIDLLIRIQTSEKSPLINNLINYLSIYFYSSNFSIEPSDRIFRKYISYLMVLADEQHRGHFGSGHRYYNSIDENEKLTNRLDLNCFQILASYFIKDVNEFYMKKNEYVLYHIKKFISKYYEPTNVPLGADVYFFERQNCLSNYFRAYNIEPPTNDQIIKIAQGETNLIRPFVMLFQKPNWEEKINIWTDSKLTYFLENKIKLKEKIQSGKF